MCQLVPVPERRRGVLAPAWVSAPGSAPARAPGLWPRVPAVPPAPSLPMPSVVLGAAAGVGCQLPRHRSQFLIGAAAAAAVGSEVRGPGSVPGFGPGAMTETSAPQPRQTGKVCLRNLPAQLEQYGLCKQPVGAYMLLAATSTTA